MKTLSILAILMTGGFLAAQEPDPAEMQKMMAKFMENMAVGDYHKALNTLAGEWTVVSKIRMGPDAPWTESGATSSSKMVLEGRYLEQDFRGDGFMGMPPFTGRGFMGYDNHKKKYVATWVDTMSTQVMMVEGTCDDTKKVFTLTGDTFDPMSQSYIGTKVIYQVKDADSYNMEMHMKMPDDSWFHSMTLVHTRKQ